MESEEEIEKGISLVRYIAGRYIRRYYHLRDDIVSVGLVALVKAWRSMKPDTDPEIRIHFQNKVVKNAIITFLRGIKKESPLEDTVTIEHPKHVTEEELCRVLNLSERDKQILSLYLQNHRVEDIGKKVGLHKVTVYQILKGLAFRWQNANS